MFQNIFQTFFYIGWVFFMLFIQSSHKLDKIIVLFVLLFFGVVFVSNLQIKLIKHTLHKYKISLCDTKVFTAACFTPVQVFKIS